MRRFAQMQDELDTYGVRIVALSKDALADVRFHRERDGAALEGVTLLADPELAVIRDYGVEHHKAIEFSTGRFQVFGIPLALVPSFKTMAIPTTLLVDEHGVIRWIDQSEDYRLRSDNALVMGAIRDVFDPV